MNNTPGVMEKGRGSTFASCSYAAIATVLLESSSFKSYGIIYFLLLLDLFKWQK